MSKIDKAEIKRALDQVEEFLRAEQPEVRPMAYGAGWLSELTEVQLVECEIVPKGTENV